MGPFDFISKSRAATTSIVGGASRRGVSVLDKHNNELMQIKNATIQNVPMTSKLNDLKRKEDEERVLHICKLLGISSPSNNITTQIPFV